MLAIFLQFGITINTVNSRPRGVALSVTKPQGDEEKAQGRQVDTPWISDHALLTGTQRASAVLFNSVLQSERRNGPRPQSEPTADKHTDAERRIALTQTQTHVHTSHIT